VTVTADGEFKPTWGYRFNQYGKTLAGILIGVGTIFHGLALRDLIERNNRTDDSQICRGDIAAFHAVVQGEIGAVFAEAVLASFQQDIPRRDTLAHQLEALLTVDYARAKDLRNRASEICEDPPDELSTLLRLERE
jgi:hypothetical protein